MDYNQILSSQQDDALPLCREIVADDAQFAQIILDVMSQYGIPRPASRQVISNLQTVRANLSEFCVLELGEKYWRLYLRRFSWPANKDPWRHSSDPGIDILATDENVELLMVIEVKSSKGDGSNLVNSASDGLKGDFKRLFEGDDRTRLLSRVLDVARDLRVQQERPDLADKAISLVGDSPSCSPGVRLIGVLVCSDQQAQDRRHRAFERLHNWLLQDDGEDSKNWQATQCKYFTVELNSLPAWLDHLLPQSETANYE
jgi:hypothetical protein